MTMIRSRISLGAALVLLPALLWIPWQASAFSRRPITTPKTTAPYSAYQDPSYNYSYREQAQPWGTPSNSIMSSLARAASDGAGRLREKGALCYRSVKQIVAVALGKNLGCIRGILSSVAAKDAGRDLERLGFRKNMSQCKTPGAIRVYRGVRVRGTRALAGDIYGHVEVVGDDHDYHSFFSSSMSMDAAMPGRRILTGCYVPDPARVNAGPAARCSSSHTRHYATPKKTKRRGGR